STQNWINKFQEYCLDIGLEETPEDINNTSKLETQLSLHNEKHYTMTANQFYKRKDSSFDVFIYKSKTNQHGLNNLSSANKILISANNPKIIADYKKSFSKRSVDADLEFYLHPIDIKFAS
ncbi:12452_t:CDS:2, partial [Cetraspora pellucida]